MNVAESREFYARQDELASVYQGGIRDFHRRNAERIRCLTGRTTGRLLDLGTGGGQNAAAAADAGFSVVAVDIVPSCLENARRLAGQRGRALEVVEGDFYRITLPRTFDVVSYWDGFGVGTDSDQRQLLARIAEWLVPGGSALIEVYTPWFWAKVAGREETVAGAIRRYGFDVAGSRMLDTWWSADEPGRKVTQSLRCYSPEDLEPLLEGSGLSLRSMESRGCFDPESRAFTETCELGESMQYLAHLRHDAAAYSNRGVYPSRLE